MSIHCLFENILQVHLPENPSQVDDQNEDERPQRRDESMYLKRSLNLEESHFHEKLLPYNELEMLALLWQSSW